MKFYAKIILISWICLSLSMIYYYRKSTIRNSLYGVKRHKSLYKALALRLGFSNEDYLIETMGCSIPNFGKQLKIKNTQKLKESCGPRAVFIKRFGDDKIVFQLHNKNMQKYVKKKMKVSCCFSFAYRNNGKNTFTYTKCTPFRNGKKYKLLEEIITVTCTGRINKKKASETIYKDSYIMVKKNNKKKKQSVDMPWNVLVLGMSTMSRERMYRTMPLTVQYLQSHKWLDYKGYHKVGNSNLINLMSLLTDKNMTTIDRNCATKSRLCDQVFIWEHFQNAGYVTAFGYDYFDLPATFTKNAFEPPTTDHHVWPYFIAKYRYQKGNYYCTKKESCGKQLLDYAYQFVDLYKTKNFFGMFWINTFTSRVISIPTLIDADIVDFFKNINKTGILKNTFIILTSDHGTTSGDIKTQVESYYEEKLPIFFMWVPYEFQKLHRNEYLNTSINKNRLTSANDLHSTMMDILKLSQQSETSKSRLQYTGLFQEIPEHRRCLDIGINSKNCACHDLENVEGDNRADECIKLVVNYIQNKLKHIETIPCMSCTQLHMKSVVRSHMYNYNDNNYYLIAIKMSPGEITYEATVLDDGIHLRILLPIVSTSNHGRGYCTLDPNDRMFCLCNITVCDKGSNTFHENQSLY